METYLYNNNVYEIYALGFITNLASEAVVYYIDSNYDANSLVIQMIDELLRPKYSDITFSCHNLGGLDVIFTLKVLNTYDDNNDNKYKISPILRDDKVIRLTIKKDDKTLSILDSYCVLTSSLDKLAKDFCVKTQKCAFPYRFYVQGHLFYKGHTPGIHFYNNLSVKDYSDIYQEDWSFKDEKNKYLKNDLNC